MAGRTTAVILEAVRSAADDWRRLLRLSRPDTWLVSGIPFAVGAFEAERALTLPFVLGLAYFLGPFALLRHGLEDIVGRGTDPAGRHAALATRTAIAITNLPLLILLVLTGGPELATALLVTVVVAVVDSVPPIRLRDRPIVDVVAGGVLLMLPAMCGLALGGGTPGDGAATGMPWVALAALATWGVATTALRAIRDDTDPERAATGRRTGTIRAVGVRLTAVSALGAYAAALVLAATLGYLGVLAALGVSLFLLLPPMILVAASTPSWRIDPPPRNPALPLTEPTRPTAEDAQGPLPPTAPLPVPAPAPTIASAVATVAAAADTARTAGVAAAARRAWMDLPGLTVLLGGWLGVLLLQGWSITTYAPWTIAIVAPTALVGYALANVIAIRIATRRRRIPSSASSIGADVPSLTIVVPTRNSIERLPAMLAALRAQTYPDTALIVVDDDSTDGSDDEAAAWIGSDAVLSAPLRPDGWSSRDWACRVGAEAATSELILFVDPDTVLAPVAARVMVEQSLARRLDLLVGLTRDAMPTPGERAAVPGFALLRFGFSPLWLAAVTRGRSATRVVGDAPLRLIRREAYLAAAGRVAAGHRSDGQPNGSAGEDAVRRIGAVRLANLASTRRYRDTGQVIRAWRRRVPSVWFGRLAGAIAIVALELAAFLVPIALPPLAVLGGVDANIVAASFAPLTALFVMRVILALAQRQSPRTLAWHPVTVGFAIAGQVAGIADHVVGRERRAPSPRD